MGKPAMDIDIVNAQGVGVQGDNIVVLFPKARMTKEEAMVQAAWLAALADIDGDDFPIVLGRVRYS